MFGVLVPEVEPGVEGAGVMESGGVAGGVFESVVVDMMGPRGQVTAALQEVVQGDAVVESRVGLCVTSSHSESAAEPAKLSSSKSSRFYVIPWGKTAGDCSDDCGLGDKGRSKKLLYPLSRCHVPSECK